METKFTPGPWKFEQDFAAPKGYMAIKAVDGVKTASTIGFTLRGFVSEGDAKLVAAAPELYSALSRILEIIECEYGNNKFVASIHCEEIGRIAQEAMEKAIGESKPEGVEG